MKKFKIRLYEILIILKYTYYKIYCYIFKRKVTIFSNCWIISERGNEARDNGYFLFKYIVEKHPEVDIRYVISETSPDFNKIKKYNKYILYGSREHYIAFLNAKILISTHLMGFSPDMRVFSKLQKWNFLNLKGKLVSLKHGITKDFLSVLNPNDTKLSLLIAGCKPEYDYMLEKNGFSKDVLKYTGFARFDNLKKVDSKRILFMPTFRKWMHYMNDSEFLNSDYYNNINGLLNDNRIISLLEEEDLELIFYPHYEFQRFLKLFNTNSKRIKLASINEYDVQELLINSNLLITDYSSVFFDFGYMEKPVIYFQFDYDMYRKSHYKEGYFSYVDNGFGPVTYNNKDVVNEIVLSSKNNFKIDKKYIERINYFFPLRDHNNCERIYKEIKKL